MFNLLKTIFYAYLLFSIIVAFIGLFLGDEIMDKYKFISISTTVGEWCFIIMIIKFLISLF